MDQIRLLSPQILDDEAERLAEMREVVARLRTPRGWHYYIDLCWVGSELLPAEGLQVLDAGAGNGIMQWWLAGQGADVLSVDFEHRPHPGLRFERWCTLREGVATPNFRSFPLREYLPPARIWRRHAWRKTFDALRSLGGPLAPEHAGSVTYLTGDLADLSGVATESGRMLVNSMTELVPCSANQRPPLTSQSRSRAAALASAVTSQV